MRVFIDSRGIWLERACQHCFRREFDEVATMLEGDEEKRDICWPCFTAGKE